MEQGLDDNLVKTFNRRIIALEAQTEKENVAKSLHDIINRLNAIESRLTNVEYVRQRVAALEENGKNVTPQIQVSHGSKRTISGHKEIAGPSSAFVNLSFDNQRGDEIGLSEIKRNTLTLSGKSISYSDNII